MLSVASLLEALAGAGLGCMLKSSTEAFFFGLRGDSSVASSPVEAFSAFFSGSAGFASPFCCFPFLPFFFDAFD